MRQPTSDINTNIGAMNVLLMDKGSVSTLLGRELPLEQIVNVLVESSIRQNSILKIYEERIRQLEYVLELRSTP